MSIISIESISDSAFRAKHLSPKSKIAALHCGVELEELQFFAFDEYLNVNYDLKHIPVELARERYMTYLSRRAKKIEMIKKKKLHLQAEKKPDKAGLTANSSTFFISQSGMPNAFENENFKLDKFKENTVNL